MNLPPFLTKSRPPARTGAVALGVFFIAYAVLQVAWHQLGVALFLGAMGIASLLAARFLSERALVTLGMAAVLVNVAAAAIALVGSAKL
jgi:hypothetical protein